MDCARICCVLSRKLAVASWSLSCFSKEGGSPGPECYYLIYQDYTPPLAGFNSTLLLLGTCCCCLVAVAAACCLLAAAGCWLPAACCLLRFAAVAVWGCWLLLVLKKVYSLELRVAAFPLSRETMLISLYP